jgi:hypothetical protein
MEAHPDYILIGSDADYMSEAGDYLFTYQNIGYTNEEINARIDDYCPFVHSTVFYRKEVVLDLGGYEVNAHTFEDYFLWKKLIKKGKVCNFKEPVIKVRFNPDSVTIDEKDREPRFNELKKKALTTGVITEEEGRELLANHRKLDKRRKEGSYHRMLGKKYLWNNYKPQEARKHLLQSLRREPFKLAAWLLLIFSLMPKQVIHKIYSMK